MFSVQTKTQRFQFFRFEERSRKAQFSSGIFKFLRPSVNGEDEARRRTLPSGRSEPSLSTDIPWGRRGWLVMFGSWMYITGRNGCWYTAWCCETDGELKVAGSAPSLPWLPSEAVMVAVCGLAFASGVGVEFLAFETSSSLVILSGLLLWKYNRAVGIQNCYLHVLTNALTCLLTGLRWSRSASAESSGQAARWKILSWRLFTRILPAGSLCSSPLARVIRRWA